MDTPACRATSAIVFTSVLIPSCLRAWVLGAHTEIRADAAAWAQNCIDPGAIVSTMLTAGRRRTGGAGQLLRVGRPRRSADLRGNEQITAACTLLTPLSRLRSFIETSSRNV